LSKAGAAAVAALRQALKRKPSIEVRRRAEALLTKLEGQLVLTAEQRRQQRAVAVLEILGTPEARRLLERLAGGAPGAWLTYQAQEGRQRLEERQAEKVAP
jgi:hypothetical protein